MTMAHPYLIRSQYWGEHFYKLGEYCSVVNEYLCGVIPPSQDQGEGKENKHGGGGGEAINMPSEALTSLISPERRLAMLFCILWKLST